MESAKDRIGTDDVRLTAAMARSRLFVVEIVRWAAIPYRGFHSLSEHYRLIFVDTRGSGLSGRPADPSKMGSADMADDLEALRIHLGLSEVSILGHSNSGAIALSYAERFPRHVDKLVLIDSQVLGLSAAGDTQRILSERASDVTRRH
jgi:pimeloyl-ACP methyl ester carboxylesterase